MLVRRAKDLAELQSSQHGQALRSVEDLVDDLKRMLDKIPSTRVVVVRLRWCVPSFGVGLTRPQRSRVQQTCPVRCLQAWLESARTTDTPVFRSLDRFHREEPPCGGPQGTLVFKREHESSTIARSHSCPGGSRYCNTSRISVGNGTDKAKRPVDAFEPTGRLPGRSACPYRTRTAATYVATISAFWTH
jgi:hypothetical protein